MSYTLPDPAYRYGEPDPGHPYLLTLDDVWSMKTIHTGQCDDLKIDDGTYRVWLSRVGVEDGMPYENAVTVEQLVDGCWKSVDIYEAK